LTVVRYGEWMPRRETQEALEREILGEKAGALARAVERLEAALAELARHDAEVGGCALGAGRGERRRDLLGEAGERLWFVVIQREAMGLRRHEVLYDVLRVPAEVRGAMGPRRR
jgi:hypothetical protein